MTLYHRLGGAAAVEQLVDELSRRLLDDPRLGPAFAELNLDVLQQHRAAYLAVILDGPDASAVVRAIERLRPAIVAADPPRS